MAEFHLGQPFLNICYFAQHTTWHHSKTPAISVHNKDDSQHPSAQAWTLDIPIAPNNRTRLHPARYKRAQVGRQRLKDRQTAYTLANGLTYRSAAKELPLQIHHRVEHRFLRIDCHVALIGQIAPPGNNLLRTHRLRMAPPMEAKKIKHPEAIGLLRTISQVLGKHMSPKAIHKA